MTQTFIDSKKTGVETTAQALDYAPWAAEIIEVEGGFMAFESSDDAATWRSQA
jgi:hypothetical protein